MRYRPHICLGYIRFKDELYPKTPSDTFFRTITLIRLMIIFRNVVHRTSVKLPIYPRETSVAPLFLFSPLDRLIEVKSGLFYIRLEQSCQSITPMNQNLSIVD